MNQHVKSYLLFALTFCLAACSLLYELLIAETLSSLATNAVVWYSLTIGLYLISLGAGALLSGKHEKGGPVAWRLWKVEAGLCAAGAGSVVLLHAGHMLMSFFWVRGLYVFSVLLFGGIAFGLVICIGFLSGAELPLLMQWNKRGQSTNAHTILAADYFGSLAAGVLFPMFLIWGCSLVSAGFGIAGVNGVIALIMLMAGVRSGPAQWPRRDRALGVTVTVCGAFVWMLGAVYAGPLNQYFLKKYYYYPFTVRSMSALWQSMEAYPRVERYGSSYQRIDVVKMPYDADHQRAIALVNAYQSRDKATQDPWRHYALFIDGNFQFYGMTEAFYHEYFAHVPVMLTGKVPARVLVLGGGDGLLVRELTRYADISQITLVELDPAMIALARAHPVLRRLNQNALADPRVDVVTQDAYSYVRQTGERFDAVYLDFPEPDTYDLSKIYSQEFYAAARSLLKEDGYLVLDAPGINTLHDRIGSAAPPSESLSVYLQTLKAAGFSTLITYASALELDNEAARALIRREINGADRLIVRERDIYTEREIVIRGQEGIIDKVLSDFIVETQQRFIFARKQPLDKTHAFDAHGIDLNILNPQRYALAVGPEPLAEQVGSQPELINSILRPTLPRPRFWWRLNFPY
jgi:spermidine synthase